MSKNTELPGEMMRLVEHKRYNTKTATLLASDRYWDGAHWTRQGRNTWLFRTPKGLYFTVTAREGEQDSLQPIDQAGAIKLYEGALSKHEVSYARAFPSGPVEDA
jgi:hypothetical protein